MFDFDEWLFQCVACLPEDATSELEDAFNTVCHHVYEKQPKLFTTPSKDDCLQKAATELSKEAQTFEEFEATCHLFVCLYNHHLPCHPDLIEPKISLPLKDEPPLIDDAVPPVGLISTLLGLLRRYHPSDAFHDNGNNDDAAYGHALLTVVFRTGIPSISLLENMLLAPLSSWILIESDNPILSLYLPKYHKRLYLQKDAIFAMYKIMQKMHDMKDNQKKKTLRVWLEAWKNFAYRLSPVYLSKHIKSLSLRDMVKYLTFFHHSTQITHATSSHHAIENHTFVRTFSGHAVRHDKQQKQNKHFNHTQGISWTGGHFKTTEQEQKSVKIILKQFELDSPKQTRQGKAFQQTSQALIQLSQKPMPWRDGLLTQWITSLFLNGSPWKAKLTASTLLNYHSVIHRFINIAWPSGDEIHGSIEAFENDCQFGIDHIQNAEEQRTILRFLTFCQQYDQFPCLDLDIFALNSRETITRAHYIPPSLFDAICQSYDLKRNSTTFPITVFMQLCYYFGLREDEALTLRQRDIDFDTGMIYVTAEKKRKSSSAIRKIPMALAPEHIRSALIKTIQAANKNHNAQLFDKNFYPALEQDFIGYVRRELSDETLVTHSLRHCAANNWVYLLATIAFNANVPSSFFDNHPLFSPAQKKHIRELFLHNGYSLTPYFPIIDWVSATIGHSAASVTMDNYLHMLDWVNLVINPIDYPINKAAIRFWTSDSQYGFERQKQLLNKDGMINAPALANWTKKHWKQVKHFSPLQPPEMKTKSVGNLSFTKFNQELGLIHQSADDKFCDPDMVRWLKISGYSPTPFYPTSSQAQAWLCFCLSLDDLTTAPLTTLNKFKKRLNQFGNLLLQNKTITRKRQLLCLLMIFKQFGLQNISIKLMARLDDPAISSWQDVAIRHKAETYLCETTEKIQASIRPYKLRWPLWDDLKIIVGELNFYLDFLLFTRK